MLKPKVWTHLLIEFIVFPKLSNQLLSLLSGIIFFYKWAFEAGIGLYERFSFHLSMTLEILYVLHKPN